ncbi:tetratricopeptide repeat protein, partial [bacterium]|nr:tetratricopeptide repeat protein [bacterium]
MKRVIILSIVFLLSVFVIDCCSVNNLRSAPQYKDKRGFVKNLSDAEVECQSGKQFMEMESYHDAIDHFQKAVSLEPDYTEAWSLLGTGFMRLKMYKESIEAFLKAFELDPEDKSLIASLGYDYLNTGDLN